MKWTGVILLLFLIGKSSTDPLQKCTAYPAGNATANIPLFKFSFSLLSEVARKYNNHFVFSPTSVWSLLTSLSEGASGETLIELQRVLNPNGLCVLQNNRFFSAIISSNKDIDLKRAGIVAVSKNEQLKRSFFNKLNKDGLTKAITLDFMSNGVSKIVNDLIANVTDNQIKSALTDDSFRGASMVLVDVLSFKGNWLVPFPSGDTIEDTFYDENNKPIGKVKYMVNLNEYKVVAAKEIGASVLELKYGSNDKYSMLIFKPFLGNKISSVIGNLQEETMRNIYKQLHDASPEPFHLQMPRFKITLEKENLNELLKKIGVRRIFEEQLSQLYEILETAQLYVSSLLQSATVEVTEQGTKASAVTTGTLVDRIGPPLFTLQKPFMFMIVEKSTGSILFGGIYSKPSVW